MAIPWKSALLAVLAAVFAAAYAYWSANYVNKLHFHPVDLKGKTALVTGATEGIGKETAIVLASWGANLILPVRGSKKSEALRADILKQAAKGVKVDIYNDVDFADFKTVREFAKKVEGEKIDILINNAGMVSPTVEATKDGNDIVYQVNHLSPFLLTYLLIPTLQKMPSARVVFVASSLHYMGSVGTYKYSEAQRGLQERRFSARYDDSKLMNVMTAITFSEHFGNNNKITFTSLNPGFVISNLDNTMPPAIAAFVSFMRQYVGRPTREGAMTQVTAATHPALDGVTGKYFSDGCMNELCNITCYYCDKKSGPGLIMNEEAYNKTSRDWLWNVSKKLTGV